MTCPSRASRVAAAAAIVASVLAVRALSAAEMSDHAVKRVKAATVLLDVQVMGQRQNGTGFLVRRDTARKTGYLLSNAHVVGAVGPGSTLRKVNVVFNPGTPDERSLPGDVVAGDRHNDLALIKVQDDALPQPIGLDRDAPLKETMPVFAVGFPLADMLAVGERRPAVTLTAGSVSSIRTDDFGVLSVVQLDCDINPGNSGGPVLDAAGNLVGIAVAKVVGTRIGFAIPPHNARALFDGTTGPADLNVTDAGPGMVRFAFEADRIDPFKRLRAAVMTGVRKDKLAGRMTPDSRGRWRPLPGAAELARLKDSAGATRFAGGFELKSKPGEPVTYLFQIALTFTDGSTSCECPQEQIVRFPETAPGGPRVPDNVSWVPLVPGRDAPAAEKSGRNCVKEDRVIDGAAFRALDVPARGIVRDMVMAADGRSLFCLDREGMLRRISLPDCVETTTLNAKAAAASLGVSSLGLLLAFSTPPYELWIVDEASLQVRRRYRTSLLEWLASSRASPYAFGNSRTCMQTLWAMDLRVGAVVGECQAQKVNQRGQASVRRHADSVLLNSFTFPTLSADAKSLFCYSFDCLCRFRVDGAVLTWEEIGPRLQAAERIDVDADGLYVAVPGSAKPGMVSDHPQIAGSYVYRAGNLQMPALALPATKYVQAIAFDGAAKLIYVGMGNVLEVRSPREGTEHGYTYGTHIERARQIIAAPQGRRLLLRSDAQLLWVELP